MNRPAPLLERHLLTRSDLASMQVPAIDVFRWLTEGCLEQVGELPAEEGRGEPVFTVLPDELRQELSEKLASIGKSTVVLTPLGVRSFLLRAILTERGLTVPDAVFDAADGGAPADAPLPEELMMSDLSEVLQNAALEVVDDVEAVLKLAAEVAASESMAPTARPAAADGQVDPVAEVVSDDAGDGYAEAVEETVTFADDTDDLDEDGEADACFDFDDLTEELGGLELDANAFAPDDVAHEQSFAEPGDPEVSDDDAWFDEREAEPEDLRDAVSEAEVHDGEATDGAEYGEPIPDGELTVTDALAADDAVDAVGPDPIDESEQLPAEPIADAAARDEEDVAAADIDTADVAVEEGDDGPRAPAEPSAAGEPDSTMPIDPAAEATLPPPAADEDVASTVAEQELAAVPSTDPQREAPEASFAGVPPIEQDRREPESVSEATTGVLPSAAAAGDETGQPDEADEADQGEIGQSGEREQTRAAIAGDAMASSAMASSAMDRVEVFLGELKNALVEMAQRPQPEPIDVEPLVHAVQAGFERSTEQATQTTSALTALARNVGKFGDQVEQGVNRSVQAALAQRAQNPAPGTAATAPTPAFVTVRPDRQTLVLGAVAVLVVCWSILFWVKSGSPRLALGTLVGANLIGCCLLLARRDRS